MSRYEEDILICSMQIINFIFYLRAWEIVQGQWIDLCRLWNYFLEYSLGLFFFFCLGFNKGSLVLWLLLVLRREERAVLLSFSSCCCGVAGTGGWKGPIFPSVEDYDVSLLPWMNIYIQTEATNSGFGALQVQCEMCWELSRILKHQFKTNVREGLCRGRAQTKFRSGVGVHHLPDYSGVWSLGYRVRGRQNIVRLKPKTIGLGLGHEVHWMVSLKHC